LQEYAPRFIAVNIGVIKIDEFILHVRSPGYAPMAGSGQNGQICELSPMGVFTLPVLEADTGHWAAPAGRQTWHRHMGCPD
jgi:hypothetical protein